MNNISNIYFVRHAQSDHAVKDDRLRPLTAKGIADAKKVTAALRDKRITAVYSSPFQRAYDTVNDGFTPILLIQKSQPLVLTL